MLHFQFLGYYLTKIFDISPNNCDTNCEKLIANSEIKRYTSEIYLAYFYEPTAGLNFEINNRKLV